jgi:hypothetical protein
MAPGQPNSVLGHLRRVAGQQATDAALLARYIASHDEQAFAVLVHRYGRLVRSVCRRVLQHAQDADDAFQATFLVFAARARYALPARGASRRTRSPAGQAGRGPPTDPAIRTQGAGGLWGFAIRARYFSPPGSRHGLVLVI